MKHLPIIGSILLSAALVACAPTQTSRGTGELFDDVTLTTKVKTEIAQTQGLRDAAEINVDTYRGVVSLAGFVNSEEEGRAAAQAATKVQGVTRVRNNLIVKPRAK